MFLDINKIGPQGRSFDEHLTLPDLEGPSNDRIRVVAARLHGRLRRQRRGVALTARLEVKAEMSCSRCLESLQRDILTDFRLILVPEAMELLAGGEEVTEDDAALFYTKEGKASTDEIATEQIYLNLPLKPICREDCSGLCSVCGANRNVTECDCRGEQMDPRLAPLLELSKQRRDR